MEGRNMTQVIRGRWFRFSLRTLVLFLLFATSWIGTRVLTKPWIEEKRLVGHSLSVRSVRFSPDGSLLVSTSFDGTARLWDVPRGKTLAILKAPRADFRDAAFSPDGKLVVTAGTDGKVTFWSVDNGALLRVIETSISPYPQWVQFSPDGQRVIVSGSRRAEAYDVESGRRCEVDERDGSEFRRRALSPDGTIQAVPSPKGIEILATGNGESASLIQKLELQDGNATFVTYSPDGSHLAAGTRGGDVVLWKRRFRERTPLSQPALWSLWLFALLTLLSICHDRKYFRLLDARRAAEKAAKAAAVGEVSNTAEETERTR